MVKPQEEPQYGREKVPSPAAERFRKEAEERAKGGRADSIETPSVPTPSVPTKDVSKEQLEKEYRKQVLEAEQRFRQDIRGMNIAEKRTRVIQMQEEIGSAQAQLSARKIQEGIIKSAEIGAKGSGVRVTGETAEAYLKAQKGEQITQEELRKLQQVGVEFEEVPIEIAKKDMKTMELRAVRPTTTEILFPRRETVDVRLVEKQPTIDPITGKVVKFVTGGYFYEAFPKFAEAEAKRDLEKERIAFEEQFPPIKVFKEFGKVSTWIGEKVAGKEFAPETRLRVSRAVEDISKFLFFAPAMATGGTVWGKKSKIAEQELKKYQALKASKAQEATDLKIAIQKAPKIELKTWVESQLRKLFTRKDIGITEKQRLAKELYAVVAEAKGGAIVRSSTGEILSATGIGAIEKPMIITIEIPPVAQMGRVGEVAATTQFFQKKFVEEEKAKVEQEIKLKLKPIQALIPKQEEKQKMISIQVLKLQQVQKQPQKQLQKQLTRLALAQKQVLKLKTVQKQIQVSKFGQGLKPVPKPTIKPIIKLPLGAAKIISRAKQIVAKRMAFEVQVRRKGKFFPISKETFPMGQALKLGAEKVRETLAATFRLVPKGVTLKPEVQFKILPLEFRQPRKAEPLTFIEIKERRLKRGTGEVPEIQYFKRIKSKSLL